MSATFGYSPAHTIAFTRLRFDEFKLNSEHFGSPEFIKFISFRYCVSWDLRLLKTLTFNTHRSQG